MSSYIKVPPAQNGPTVGVKYGTPTSNSQPEFHTSSSRNYAPIVDNYPEASGLLQGLSRTAQRFAGAVAVEKGVVDHPEESTGRLGSPADHLRNSDGATGEFMRREIGGGAWFDKIADRSRPATTAPSAMPTRSGYQPALADNHPVVRPRFNRGPEAIDAQSALSAGPTGVHRGSPVQATHKPSEVLALGPGPAVATEGPQRPQTRLQKRSGKQSETLGGIDWSNY